MDNVVAYRGGSLTIEWARIDDGSLPGMDFYDGLQMRCQARLQTLFSRLGETGRIQNCEHFSRFDDEFYEFKAFSVRMPCYFRTDKRVIITHGFWNKKKGATLAETERAKSIKNACEEMLASRKKCRRIR
jgi:hypothetical protein